MSATPKSARTRAQLISAALKLLRERGFAGTTVRAIAEESGVALGAAYYYFESKEELTRAAIASILADYAAALPSELTPGNALEHQLRTAWESLLEALSPYSSCGRALMGAPLPASIRLAMAHTVAAASPHPPRPIRQDLPELLALATRAVLTLWAHDDTDDDARTRALIARLAPFAARATVLARLPVVRRLADELLTITRATAAEASPRASSAETGTRRAA
ncbi:TetR/AcrR family transcriptional regulator [Zhihengliuella flava]|uniref:AcrR family transcriptional regulator n=1 Tax=Zhihengliuella flava TaxID=1285193 RepID=A0A931GJB0_9MICC|nr:AcrR family transcriptional regulator [Zhihengliuella flava]